MKKILGNELYLIPTKEGSPKLLEETSCNSIVLLPSFIRVVAIAPTRDGRLAVPSCVN